MAKLGLPARRDRHRPRRLGRVHGGGPRVRGRGCRAGHGASAGRSRPAPYPRPRGHADPPRLLGQRPRRELCGGRDQMALWDILGKSLEMPVHALLGGRLRDSAVVYSNAWYFGAQTADEFAQRAAQTVAEGYRALKFDPFGSAGLTISEAELADSIGRVAPLSGTDRPRGRAPDRGARPLRPAQRGPGRRALERFDLLFFEEPCRRGRRRPSPRGRLGAGADRRGRAMLQRPRMSARDRVGRGAGAAARRDPRRRHRGAARHLVGGGGGRGVVAPHNASGPVATAATLQMSALARRFSCRRCSRRSTRLGATSSGARRSRSRTGRSRSRRPGSRDRAR